ncbi:hypothetical protein PIB30_082506 [Stylosanthes scabra]|uniref:Uncharacterized protein n=1 Tax=Stylosanthes scabra TaxID=79078 RepID=A0ABU6WQC5_9FABA|nr:hypothetical protein [Stylosanthes scabra]
MGTGRDFGSKDRDREGIPHSRPIDALDEELGKENSKKNPRRVAFRVSSALPRLLRVASSVLGCAIVSPPRFAAVRALSSSLSALSERLKLCTSEVGPVGRVNQ